MSLQMVELHSPEPFTIDLEAIRARTQEILGEEIVTPGAKEDGKGPYVLAHMEHMIDYEDRKMPIQTAMLLADEPIDMNKCADELQQSWACKEAETLLADSKHTILVTEMMAQLGRPADRLKIYHGALQAIVESTKPKAMLWKHSQQVLAPETYLDACDKAPALRPGAVNVRFFNVTNSEGEMLMDTRGLDEIGLHDFQCHFRDLDPNKVAEILFNTAMYVVDNGPVIQNNEAIDGIEPGSQWGCQFENPLIGPDRDVLDLNPGPPHAAGKRE